MDEDKIKHQGNARVTDQRGDLPFTTTPGFFLLNGKEYRANVLRPIVPCRLLKFSAVVPRRAWGMEK